MRFNLDALLLRANTHAVANTGIIATAIAGIVHVATHVLPGAGGGVLAGIDDITAPLATSGALLAYFGRPSTVPAKPTAETMETIAKSPVASAAVEQIAADLPAFDKGSRVVRSAPVDTSPPPSGPSGAYNAPASSVGADVPRPSRLIAALLHVAGTAGGRSPMNIQGQIADAIVGYYDANKGALGALLASKNVTIVSLVENAAEALVAKNPMLSLIFGGEIKGLAPQITALLGSEEAAGLAALDALLHAEAAKFGG